MLIKAALQGELVKLLGRATAIKTVRPRLLFGVLAKRDDMPAQLPSRACPAKVRNRSGRSKPFPIRSAPPLHPHSILSLHSVPSLASSRRGPATPCFPGVSLERNGRPPHKVFVVGLGSAAPSGGAGISGPGNLPARRWWLGVAEKVLGVARGDGEQTGTRARLGLPTGLFDPWA